MLVGHYGPSFAAKAWKKPIPLWVLFLAVQWVDIMWATFILLGIEKVRIVPGITATNPFDLYYMPYTHSLLASFLWSVAAACVYRLFFRRQGWGNALVVGAAVLSHWFLDLIVHRPDLPLYDNAMKVGLGLWNYPLPAFLTEMAVLFGGMILYMGRTRAKNRMGRYGMWIFGAAMGGIQILIFFGPTPTSNISGAITALTVYFLFAGIAYWLEKKRI